MDNDNGQKNLGKSPPPIINPPAMAQPTIPVITHPAAISSSSSPLPPKPTSKIMGFAEAMDEVRRGKKIHKLEWKDKNYYGFLSDARLRLHKPDSQLYDWIITEGDIIGNDWIVI